MLVLRAVLHGWIKQTMNCRQFKLKQIMKSPRQQFLQSRGKKRLSFARITKRHPINQGSSVKQITA